LATAGRFYQVSAALPIEDVNIKALDRVQRHQQLEQAKDEATAPRAGRDGQCHGIMHTQSPLLSSRAHLVALKYSLFARKG